MEDSNLREGRDNLAEAAFSISPPGIWDSGHGLPAVFCEVSCAWIAFWSLPFAGEITAWTKQKEKWRVPQN